MKKPWAGRFKEQTSKVVESFTESISFDHRLWKCDIEGSIAHAKMLSKQRIIPKSDAVKIMNGLREIAEEIETGKLHFREDLEDIHMNIEAALIKKTGDAGGKLHTRTLTERSGGARPEALSQGRDRDDHFSRQDISEDASGFCD